MTTGTRPESGIGPAGGTADARHLDFLDGWRGLAILLVLAGHFTPLGQAGNLGVELFFVLSGRLMAEILIVRRQPIGLFVQRRSSRILPALLAFVAIVSALCLASATPEEARRLAVAAAATLLFFQNYLPADWSMGAFQHCWSLAVEEHSYLVLAAIAVLSGRRPQAAMRAAAALAALGMLNGAWQSWGAAEAPHLYARSDVRGASICISFALFLWLREQAAKGRRPPSWAAPAALLLGLALGFSGASESLRYTLGTALLAIGVNSLDAAAAPLRRVFEEPVLRWAGIVSFSLYLWQQPFYIAYHDGAPLLATLPFVFLCAVCSHYGVERPARRFLNGLGTRQRGVAARA